MKALTLTDYINHKLKTDPEFAKYYAREQIINDVAEMIINARKTAKVSQARLAKKIGTTQSVISRLESGKTRFIPSLDTLARIASALKMKLQLHIVP